MAQYRELLTFNTAKYYSEHLNATVPIVIVTDSVQAYSSLGTVQNVFVLSLGDYLDRFWPHLIELRALFTSLSAAIEAINSQSEAQDGGGSSDSLLRHGRNTFFIDALLFLKTAVTRKLGFCGTRLWSKCKLVSRAICMLAASFRSASFVPVWRLLCGPPPQWMRRFHLLVDFCFEVVLSLFFS